MEPLKLITSFEKDILGQKLQILVYKSSGYEIKISKFETIDVIFTAVGGIYQPEIIFAGKDSYLNLNGTCFLPHCDQFIENVRIAKELAIYVHEHLEELLHSVK